MNFFEHVPKVKQKKRSFISIIQSILFPFPTTLLFSYFLTAVQSVLPCSTAGCCCCLSLYNLGSISGSSSISSFSPSIWHSSSQSWRASSACDRVRVVQFSGHSQSVVSQYPFWVGVCVAVVTYSDSNPTPAPRLIGTAHTGAGWGEKRRKTLYCTM